MARAITPTKISKEKMVRVFVCHLLNLMTLLHGVSDWWTTCINDLSAKIPFYMGAQMINQ